MPASHRRRGRSAPSDRRLRTLGKSAPPLRADLLSSMARERARRIGLRIVWITVALLVCVFAGVQWFRPIPTPVFRVAVSTSVRLPGSLPSLPWPSTGSAALSLDGAESLGNRGNTQPVPIAGLAKVMTAFVVLQDHPLAPGTSGPAIPVTTATIAAAQSERAAQQSVVPVVAGETLTELEALEGLLVAQGNDIATLLTDWDASSTTAFVAKMNAAAHAMNLGSTKFTDPSGLDPGSVSTPTDMIRLGKAAMAIPIFREVVAMPQVTLPLTGLIYNFDYDLGHDGIIGLKTGSDSAAGGCFLFEAQQTVAGHGLTLVGAVLGQYGTSPITTALYYAELIVHAAFSASGTLLLLSAGHVVGRIVAPWGQSVPVTTPRASSVVGWPGLIVPVQLHLEPLKTSIPDGTRIGVLAVNLAGQNIDEALLSARRLPGPSVIWRLTHL